MDTIVFLVLRRMRSPLVLLILSYAISILGMVLVPGVDVDGNPAHMSLFHAFYFISYTATTIGFGEIPYAFSDAQRWWALVSIYLTVITWFYAIGKIVALVQEPAFRQALAERNFTRGVKRLGEPFHIVVGYGDTGSQLVRALAQRAIRAVVIDSNPERLNDLDLADLPLYVPGLCADGSASQPLIGAGLKHPQCLGVVALTDDDQANLKIAITAKLLNPRLQVICRAENQETVANMASFGTDHIINPFDTFGDHLALALHSPGTHLLHEWVTGVPGGELPTPLYPPRGIWVLCGYGRFGKAVQRGLAQQDMDTVIIEADPLRTGCDRGCVVGRGTEAATLLQADVTRAVGIVAGTDNDANNLSVIITARELNPSLFTIARQNRHDSDAIFAAAGLDLVMQRSRTVAQDIFALLTTPLLSVFLARIRDRDNDWANQLVARISAVSDTAPELWSVTIDLRQAPAVVEGIAAGWTLTLDTLLRDARERTESLPVLPLLLVRDGEALLTPESELVVRVGDQILLCGAPGLAGRLDWTLRNANTLRYICSGAEGPDGYVWRWLERKLAG